MQAILCTILPLDFKKVKAVISNKYIIRLTLPILFAQIIPKISFVANSIFLGKFGELELRVNGVAGIFYLTFTYGGVWVEQWHANHV